jgi:hypothetical protein
MEGEEGLTGKKASVVEANLSFFLPNPHEIAEKWGVGGCIGALLSFLAC